MYDRPPISIVTYRWDPFTESFQAIQVLDEDREIPSSSPYRVRLYEVPREDSPSTVDVVILVELDEDLDNSETDVDVLAAHYDRVQVGDVVLCDTEQMLVDAKPGSPTLTVTRGYGGTTPETWPQGTLMEILNSMTEISSGAPATREFRVDYEYNTGLVLFNSAEAGYDIRCDYWGLGSPFHGDIIGFREWQMASYDCGDNLHPDAQCNNTDVLSAASYTKYKEMKLDRFGNLRIKFDLKMQTAGGSVYGKIYRNGNPVGTERTTTLTDWQTFSEDISFWSAGDLLQLYGFSSGANDGEARNLRCYIEDLIQVEIIDD